VRARQPHPATPLAPAALKGLTASLVISVDR